MENIHPGRCLNSRFHPPPAKFKSLDVMRIEAAMSL
jgi:hypothetical protein